MGDVASSLITYLKGYRKDYTDPSSDKKWRDSNVQSETRLQLMPIRNMKDVGEAVYLYSSLIKA